MPPWVRNCWYDFTYWASFFGMTLGWSLRVSGRRHMPRKGPVLVIANHQSFLDPLITGLASPRRMSYLARETLFINPFLGTLLRSLNGVPIDHRGFSREGLQTMLDLLERGEVVVVYPEGERTHDGRMHPLKPGITLLIKRIQAPVVPMGVAGAFDAWSRFETFPTPSPLFLPPTKRTVAAAIGPAIDPAPLAKMGREEMLEVLTAHLADAVREAERIRRK